MSSQKTIPFALAVGFLAVGMAWSNDAMMSSGQPTMASQVLSALHQTNQNEIEMGRMAKEKGSSNQVRSYGDRLVKDHSDADKQVESLAQKDGIILFEPSTQGLIEHHKAAEEQKVMAKLSSKNGIDFDKAFAQAMVDDHKRDISKFQKAEKALQQTDVRELVARLLPTLMQDLQMAEQLQENG